MADANGTYVALTRARERTRIYASVQRLSPGDEHHPGRVPDREALVEALAEQLGRLEVEVPSIAVALAHEQQVAREHARESAPTPSQHPDHDADRGEGSRRQAPDQREQQRAGLDRAREQRDQARVELARAGGEREQAARVLASRPRDPEAQHVLADAQYAAGQAQHVAAHGQQLAGQLAGLRFQRLGQQGRTLKAQLAAARDRERQAAERQRRLEHEAAARQARLDRQRQAWEVEHPGARERHQSAQHAYERAHDLHQAAEQIYDSLLAQDLVNAAVPEPGARQWPRPLEPGDALELPARPEIERGREGPSFGL